MASNDLNRSIKIYIDGSEATQGIQPVKDAIKKLEAQLASLSKGEADYEEKSKKLKKELESKNRTLVHYQEKVEETKRVLNNLSGATYQELLAVQKQVQKELRNSVPGTQRYTAALEQNRRVSAAVVMAQREMRVEVGAQGSMFARAADSFNRYAGVVTSGLAAITGLTFAMRGTVKVFTEMDTAQAQVIKYTGMSKEEVRGLNEAFKEMDTRTGRDELNKLAGEAGKLGETSRQAVLDYATVGDMINVALGEDLGEEAVAQIAKMAKMFGEDERMGLRGAMLATGSAINEVAQNSAAAERYLVDFTARVAGVAHQAGISQSSLFGLAATMDENMLRNETAATAFQNILLKMMTDTEKFAQVAGLSVQEFSELVRTDANEALLTFATALKAKGGMADLAPIFGDLNTEGAGVASMLSVLAGKAKEVRANQSLANTAYAEGTSILNEFNIQNNITEAKLDKAKKGFLEISIALGEKLMPVMSSMISGSSLLVRGMDKVVTFTIKNHREIILLTSAIAGYTVAVKADVAWEKLRALWLDRNITKQKILNTLSKTNTIGLVTAAVTAAVSAFILWKKKTDALTESLKEMQAETAKERISLDAIFDSLQRANPQSEQRRKLIEQINEQYGQYLPYLLTEKSSLDDVKAAYDRINTALTEQIALKHKSQAIGKVAEKYSTEQIDSVENIRQSLTGMIGSLSSSAIDDIRNVTAEFYKAGMRWQDAYDQAYTTIKGKYFGKKSMAGFAAEEMEDYIQSYYKMQTELSKIDKKFSVWSPKGKPANELDEVVVTAPKNNNGPTSTNPLSDDGKKEELEAAVAAENEIYHRQKLELQQLYVSQDDENLRTHEAYLESMEQLEIAHLQRTLEIAGLDGEARQKIEEQLMTYKIRCQKEIEDNEKRMAEKAQKDEEKRKQEREKKEKREAQQKKANEEKSREEYAKHLNTLKGYTDEFASAVGQVIAGQKSALEAFGNLAVDVVFDVLDQIIQAQLTQLTVKATAATAEGTMHEIGSKGILGIGTSAAIAAAVNGLLMTAKAALKGLIGKRPSSVASSSQSDDGSRRVVVGQYACGRYEVVGADDGQLYRDVPYLGPAPTGIVTRPALISERGAELIINADDLARLQHHINFPLVMQTIADVRRGNVGAVTQYAAGRGVEELAPIAGGSPYQATNRLLLKLLQKLDDEGVAATVVLSDFEKKQELRNRSRRIGSKNRKKNIL